MGRYYILDFVTDMCHNTPVVSLHEPVTETGDKMGRKPLGDKAMTAAERQRKRRAMLADEKRAEWRPEYLPGQNHDHAIARHNEFMDSLFDFLQYGDRDAVTEFLADVLIARPVDENILQTIADRIAELERQAVAEEQERDKLLEEEAEKWLAAHPGKDVNDYMREHLGIA